MKIFSKFQDYYDCALGSFLESDVTVSRKHLVVEERYAAMPDMKEFDGDWDYRRKGRYNYIYASTQIYMIGFCGTWYFYIWDRDDRDNLFLRYVTFDEIIKNNTDSSLFKWKGKEQEFRDPNKEKYWQDLFEKYGPVLHCQFCPPPRYYVPFSDSEKLKMKIDVWPTLKEHQFIQVKDPYTALWEIEHWFDTHARPDEAIVPVGDDITRLQAYGFDKKTSFRKAKEK